MKAKTVLTIFATFILLAQTPTLTLSQTGGFAPEAAASFSIFGTPQNIGTTVNTAGDESSPFVAPNGLSLYFSGQRDGTLGAGDIWVSQRPTLTSAWGPPQNLGAVINTTFNDNTPSLSPDGKTLFFNSDRPDLGGLGGQDIYMSTRTDTNNDFGWSTPVNLGSVINTSGNDGGANYFEDPVTGAGTLYFIAIRAGGFGDLDIYQSLRLPGGTFLPPINVTPLNSSAREARPAIRRDGLEMFFTSDRAGGAGGIDIYVSTRSSTQAQWNPPVNVSLLNTNTLDGAPGLSPDGAVLYLMSQRPGGNGGNDLYTAARVSVNRTATADFDGDGRTDLSVFRPSDGSWHILNSGTNTYRAQPFGLTGDKPAPGDYDGDSRTDLAVFRPSNGTWWIMRSSDNSVSTINWGISTDKPVPADYDADGRTDIAVFREGTWYIMQSSNGNIRYEQFGLSGDIPVAAGMQ